MKKGLLSVIIIVCCCFVFLACNKNNPNSLTPNPSMSASIQFSTVAAGAQTDTFIAESIIPSTIVNQVDDTANTIVITGNSELLQSTPGDQIILSIRKYQGLIGTFSIAQGQAGASYVHNRIPNVSLGGIVSITNITSSSIIGYFSFTTPTGFNIVNGSFNVSKP